jgi:peptidoglycan hydrolase-like protein with peptidoglycan-binding domain
MQPEEHEMVDRKRWLGGSLMVFSLGCGAPTEDTAGDATRELQTLDRDLALDSSGTDVAAVHRYLHRYGYFANDELTLQFPAWRAIVDDAPSDTFVYDDKTAEAVRELQRRAGIPDTGVVDAATRDVLRMPRCSFPDSRAPDEMTVKYVLHNTAFTTQPITWRLSDGAFPQLGLSLTQTRALVNEALAKWAAVTTLSFSEVGAGSAANIRIDWINDANDAIGGTTGTPARGKDVKINSHYPMSIDSDVPGNANDLKWVLAHELGHALGLGHGFAPIGAASKPMMYYGLSPGLERRALTTDDQQGISVLYDTWESITGAANDVSINWYTNELIPATTQYVWHVGSANESDGLGKKVYRGSGSTRELATGGKGATRIAVDHSGRPWIVNSNGQTYRRSSSSASSGTWQLVAGCARDIAAAPGNGGTFPPVNVQVWKIDCTDAADGGGGIIKKWDNTLSNWISAVEGADRIALDSLGYPWVVARDDSIWQRTSKDPAVMSWIRHGDGGEDVAVSGSCATVPEASNTCWVWVTGTDGFVWLRNLQAGQANTDTPAVDGWWRLNQQATNIAVEKSGRPWVASGASFNRIVK